MHSAFAHPTVRRNRDLFWLVLLLALLLFLCLWSAYLLWWPQPVKAAVNFKSGSVIVSRDGGPFQPIEEFEELQPGDVIKTEKDSYATIDLGGQGSLELFPETEIEIKELEVDENEQLKVEIEHKQGMVRSEVLPLPIIPGGNVPNPAEQPEQNGQSGQSGQAGQPGQPGQPNQSGSQGDSGTIVIKIIINGTEVYIDNVSAGSVEMWIERVRDGVIFGCPDWVKVITVAGKSYECRNEAWRIDPDGNLEGRVPLERWPGPGGIPEVGELACGPPPDSTTDCPGYCDCVGGRPAFGLTGQCVCVPEEKYGCASEPPSNGSSACDEYCDCLGGQPIPYTLTGECACMPKQPDKTFDSTELCEFQAACAEQGLAALCIGGMCECIDAVVCGDSSCGNSWLCLTECNAAGQIGYTCGNLDKPANCGDGKLGPGEECEQGNLCTQGICQECQCTTSPINLDGFTVDWSTVPEGPIEATDEPDVLPDELTECYEGMLDNLEPETACNLAGCPFLTSPRCVEGKFICEPDADGLCQPSTTTPTTTPTPTSTSTRTPTSTPNPTSTITRVPPTFTSIPPTITPIPPTPVPQMVCNSGQWTTCGGYLTHDGSRPIECPDSQVSECRNGQWAACQPDPGTCEQQSEPKPTDKPSQPGKLYCNNDQYLEGANDRATCEAYRGLWMTGNPNIGPYCYCSYPGEWVEHR